MTGARAVAPGGGHGLAASPGALRRVTRDLTALVTAADDGGSSGRLRRGYGVLAPGDLLGDAVAGPDWVAAPLPQPGETGGFSPRRHPEVPAGHAPALTVDVVLADTRAARTGNLADLEKAASMLGARLVMADAAAGDGAPRHDPRLLAGAFAQILAAQQRRWGE